MGCINLKKSNILDIRQIKALLFVVFQTLPSFKNIVSLVHNHSKVTRYPKASNGFKFKKFKFKVNLFSVILIVSTVSSCLHLDY